METQVLGLSVDSVPSLKAWADSLDGITYPLVSDFYPHGQVAKAYGVLRSEGYTERAIFVVDKRGIIRFAKIYPMDEQPDNNELFDFLVTLEPHLARFAREVVPDPLPEDEAQPSRALTIGTRVTMYCTPWCPACRRARSYFNEHGITYDEIDITKDRVAAAKVRGWANGFETTPTFEVHSDSDDQAVIIVNFNREKLDPLLGVE